MWWIISIVVLLIAVFNTELGCFIFGCAYEDEIGGGWCQRCDNNFGKKFNGALGERIYDWFQQRKSRK
jgi:hypothetical protein